MELNRSVLFGCLLLLSFPVFCQTSNTIFGAGYTAPAPINAAPGQILNLFVQGVGANLSSRVTAGGLPLPTVLAGISVQLTQTYSPQSVPVPLLAVRPVSTCPGGSLGSAPCGRFAEITVQIPYELVPVCQWGIQICPVTASPALSNSAQLIVSENGVAGGAIQINPVADQVHIANLCDIDMSGSAACASTPLITHADGSLISASNPAKLGEQVVIYALGLGATKPAAGTGQAGPSPAPVANVQEVNFQYEPNAGPSRGLPLQLTSCSTTPACPLTPVFAGLTPGFVGLYQVNFVIPTIANRVLACGPGITSNLTLTVIGLTSFDGAGICVAMPTSQARPS
jgi:hypothetical protein